MSVSLEETIAKLDEVHKRGLLGIYGIKISRILKLLRELQERRKQPEITQDQLEEYCKKRCLTVITNDLYYKLTSGSKDTATLATMSSAVSPYNETFAKFIDELLAYEERNDMLNLTTKERAEFQAYVRERMEL